MQMTYDFLGTGSSSAMPVMTAGSRTSVSVVVPAYNYAAFLPECLNSIIEQPGIGVELIVVDDGSTDDTRRLVESFGGNVTYVYQNNAGLSAARNTGLRRASGEYILFLDADDLLGADTLESRVRFLDRNPTVDIAVCRSRFLGGSGWLPWHREWVLPERDLLSHLMAINIGPPHAFLTRRRVADHVGWFDTSLPACEDYDYWWRAATRGFVVAPSPGYVLYRKHPASMSANAERQLTSDIMMHEKVLAWLDSLVNIDLLHWLSYVAGLLLTVAKGRHFGVRVDVQPLVEGALRLGAGHENFTVDSTVVDNLDTYLTLLNRLDDARKAPATSLRKLWDSVWDAILSHRLPSTRRACIRAAAGFLSRPGAPCVSAARLRVATMLTKRIVVGCKVP
jgi:GT2 family glycosyltransferase